MASAPEGWAEGHPANGDAGGWTDVRMTPLGNARWRAQLDRLFADGKVAAMQMEINDFAATPGVSSLRLAQALEELSA